MAGKWMGLAILAAGLMVSGAANAQGFSGSGAAGYAQSQGWTASAGVKPKGADDASAVVDPWQRATKCPGEPMGVRRGASSTSVGRRRPARS